jgi:hypothetical protein
LLGIDTTVGRGYDFRFADGEIIARREIPVTPKWRPTPIEEEPAKLPAEVSTVDEHPAPTPVVSVVWWWAVAGLGGTVAPAALLVAIWKLSTHRAVS